MKIHSLLDPLGDRARNKERDDTMEPVLLIGSNAATLLTSELRRYCRGEITGRSFLVAGHRGSGKTTLTGQAFLDVLEECRKQNRPTRPLYVLLHGPNLFPDPRRNAPPPPPPALPTVPAGQPEPLRIVLEHVGKPEPASTKQESEPEPKDLRRTLEQIVLCLHRAFAREISDCYRQRATESPQELLQERLELAAQLEVELWECPSAQRLRELWRRAEVLYEGVLFDPLDAAAAGLAPRHDQGLLELVALTGVCEAYRRISGTYTRQESQQDAASSKSDLSLALDSTGKNLFGPLLSILTGGLVGAGLFASTTDALQSTLAGFLAAFGASMIFKFSASRSRERALASQQTFLFDMTVATLDRILPMLIQRLQHAGLAPMFVIDELDKVENTVLPGVIGYLKKLVAERAFFCFLTDRSYFEEILCRSRNQAYSMESSFFAHRLFVAFQFSDFHSYVEKVLVQPEEPRIPAGMPAAAQPQAQADLLQPQTLYKDEKLDVEVVPWVLLHRARMHALDLRRLLEEWLGKLRPGEIRTTDEFRFDVTIQVAVEMVLTQPILNRRLRQQPEFTQIVHDALYYISRRWKDLDPLDLDDRESFRQHLEQRSGAQVAAQSGVPQLLLEQDDLDFLLERVRELANLLSSADAFVARLNSWNKDRTDVGLKPLEDTHLQTLREVLRLTDLPYPLPLLSLGGSWWFDWRFRPDGRPGPNAGAEVASAVNPEKLKEDMDLIQEIESALEMLTG